ncbi:MAG: bacillithiol biosynthesis cysteine-adding enzyme BshC [Chitinophagales bacterium]|nr:bacillithiol biosynthesis cysteine-adding enzyme BshC [Chitinophagales bacterium]MDW8427980.1 bacillithiol biosynthesis cysteine-adding enzyme BshC [Chitinophagales bacterium]
MLKKTYIDYEATGYFKGVVIDYLRGHSFLKNFYTYPPLPDSISALAALRSQQPYDRQTLITALSQQHQRLWAEVSLPAVQQSIASLADPRTVTITTAHQPALFLGPLFVIYKTVSTIRLAAYMNSVGDGFRYVPVFWLGSEDHDKQELNHIHLFGRTLTWNTAQEGAFGRMSTSSLRPWIQEIKNMLGSSPAAGELGQALDQAYLRERTIAAATRRLLYYLFGHTGLIVIDGDDALLKRKFVPIMERELTDQLIFRILGQANEKFSIHYTPQIVAREINLFYLSESSRQRITREGVYYRIGDGGDMLTKEQMQELVHSQPQNFSPNVALRAVYQEHVLPDAAIVGGGSEVTYWLQLSVVFRELQVPPPVLMLRNSLLWIDPVNAERLQKARISEEDLFLSAEEMVKKYLKHQLGDTLSLQPQIAALNAVFDQALQQVMEWDPSLRASLEADRVRTVKIFEQLEDRLRRAAKRKEEAAVQLIYTLKEKLFPMGRLQERHENFMNIYSRLGPRFIETLLQEMDPLDYRFLILTELNESA